MRFSNECDYGGRYSLPPKSRINSNGDAYFDWSVGKERRLLDHETDLSGNPINKDVQLNKKLLLL